MLPYFIGTTVTCDLETDGVAPNPTPPETVPMARILVVDDDEMQRVLSSTILEDAGHELSFARDGAAALMFLRRNDVDVVVTDLDMPRIDGLRVIEDMRELDDRVPIIVVSGTSPGNVERADELGAFATLHKPITRQGLMDAVNGAVDQRREGGWL